MLTYFTPGPSQLYFTVQDHMRRAIRDGIPSISHRSKEFEHIYAGVQEGLRELLGVPDGFIIAFAASATEIWERSLQSLVAEKSFHLVNGAFSARYYEIARQLQIAAEKTEVKPGQAFDQVKIPAGAELIGVTHNETSTGVSLSIPFIHALRQDNPEALVFVDAVSSLPYPDFDYSKIDSVYFSVQKGFGLPSGLAVWMYNERCVERAERNKSNGRVIGSYHSILSLTSFAKKNQTPETPNILGIFLLDKVLKDFVRRGISTIRKETEYKAHVLYNALSKRSDMRPFVANPADRSMTIVTVEVDSRLTDLQSWLWKKGFQAGEGYGEFKSRHLRIANFPAHSKEQVEALADAIGEFGS